VKRIIVVSIAIVIVAALALGSATALAAKPQSVIEKSNGFPSGEHFNLNIHGKKADFICDPTPGGGSVFVDEVGPATIQYVSNKKSSVGNLTVLDPCAVDGGTAKVQLPYEPDGYYAFGRILGKPNNGAGGTASSIILYPNVAVQACNDDPANPDPDFGNYTNCDDALLALGMITNQLFLAEEETYVRFDPAPTKGKGKSKATDITRLFTYVGWVIDERLDTASWNSSTSSCEAVPDGSITFCDVPHDYTGDSIINDEDIEPWLEEQANLPTPMAWFFELNDGMWIFNIADLVVTEQGLVNDGTKLLQIRFYPVDTTEFEPQ
jgi:hypothetical protein